MMSRYKVQMKISGNLCKKSGEKITLLAGKQQHTEPQRTSGRAAEMAPFQAAV